MHFTQAAALLLAPDDSSSGVTNHDTLYGIMFTGVVTLILGYLTYRSKSQESKTPVVTPTPAPSTPTHPSPSGRDPRDAEITYLRRQLDAVQRKYDGCLDNQAYQGLLIAHYREQLIENGVDPDKEPPPTYTRRLQS